MRRTRRILIPLLAFVVLVVPGCKREEDKKEEVKRALDRTVRLSRQFAYLDQAGTVRLQVVGVVEDDFRHKARLTLNGAPVLEEVASDDALAMRFLEPGALPNYLVGGGTTAATAFTPAPGGIGVLDALRTRRWVLDPEGAPDYQGTAGDTRQPGEDPIFDALTVQEYVRRAVDAEGAAAHIGAIEVELENLVLAQPRLQPERQKRLLHLALDGALVVEEQVLGELLRDRRTALAHAAGLRVGQKRARGAGDVDAEMVVEAAVFGGERRLDQHVRKIFQRDRVVVLDAAVADRIAVSVEEADREVGFLQPVVVGGLAEGGDRERQHQHGAAEAQRGGFRERLDDDPALPAADIEAVHEGRVALIELAQALGGREQRGIDARIHIQHQVLDLLLPLRRHDPAHESPTFRSS